MSPPQLPNHSTRRLPQLLALALTLALMVPAAAQTFLQPTVIPTGNWPAAVYSADINADGFADLVYIDQGATATSSTTHVLLNDGKGNFTQSATLATAGTSLAIADMDGDGHLDVVWVAATPPQGAVTENAYTATIVDGRGDGTFSPPAVLGVVGLTPFNPPLNSFRFSYLVAGHFYHKTGRLDLAYQELTRNGLCTVIGPTIYDSGCIGLPAGTGPMVLADLNGDGYQDLVFQQGTAGVAVALGGPYNVPPITSTYTGVSGVHSFLLQPVDNDPYPDLVLEGANGRFDIFHGNGDGTFATSSEGGSGALDGLTGHGGHLIAETTVAAGVRRNFYTATPAGISVLTGNGNLTYTLQGISNAGPGRTSYAFADFNHDGFPDLALDSPEGIAILFGNADGSFQTSQAFAAGAPATSLALGSFTSAALPDAVVATAATQAQLLRNNSDGTFTAASAPTTSQTGTPNLIATLQTGDFNGDGHLDLALTADGPNASLPASGATGIAVQFGDGTGNFTAPVFPTAAAQFTDPNPAACSPPFDHYPNTFFGTSVLADFTGDGLADLANRDASAYRILRGNNGSSADSSTILPTLFFSQVDGPQTGTIVDCHLHAHDLVVAGDLDNDGHPDLLYQGSGPNSGSFTVFVTHGSAAPTLLGDLAVDGALTTPGQLTAPALSPVFGGISPTLGFPAFPGSAVIADLDGDGLNDLAILYHNLSADLTAPTANAPNYLYIWYGSGGGKFLTSTRHPTNPVRITPSRNFYQLAATTLNGTPVLLMSDGSILSYGPPGSETHLLGGQGINAIAAADLNGDGRSDLVLANGGTLLANPVANKDVLTPNPGVNTGGITVLLGQRSATPTGTVTATPNPAPFEAAYTLTATLSTTSATGTATFSVDSASAGTAAVLNGVATLPVAAFLQGSSTPPLLPGTHTLTAAYSGDANDTSATLTGSFTVSLAPTTVTLTPNTPLSTPYGNPINGTFLVTVVDQAYPATGTYTVLDNGVAVPQCTALTLLVSCPYGDPQLLHAGPHTLTVAYNGDPINAPSLSNAVPFIITPDTTSATVISSLNPATVGSAVTFTANLTGSVLTPTGQIQFLDNGVILATATLSPTGVATLTTSTLTLGTHPITVAYGGTQDFQPSTSLVLNQQIVAAATPPVAPPGFTLTVTPNPVILGVGQTALLQVTITPTGSFAQPVQLTCSGLPSEATCVFVRPLLPTTGGNTTLQLTAASPHDCNVNTPYYPPSTTTTMLRPLSGLVLAALLLTGGLFRRRLPRALLIALFSAALLTALTPITACGRCTDLGTYPGSYTVTVTATPQGTPNTTPQSQPITMKVTLQ